MKEICKDYYKYSRFSISMLQAIKYSFSSDRYKRGLAAQYSKTPVSVLIRLSRDFDSTVIHYVASNPNTPFGILYILYKEINDLYLHKTIRTNPTWIND